MNAPKPDPRQELRRKFLKGIADEIEKETVKERKSRGGQDGEMESKEVFRVYSNASKALQPGNRLINVLEKKETEKETADEAKIQRILGKSSKGVKPILIDLPKTGVQEARMLQLTSLDEIRRLDKEQERLVLYDARRNDNKARKDDRH
jgi:hypothetical protein